MKLSFTRRNSGTLGATFRIEVVVLSDAMIYAMMRYLDGHVELPGKVKFVQWLRDTIHDAGYYEAFDTRDDLTEEEYGERYNTARAHVVELFPELKNDLF